MYLGYIRIRVHTLEVFQVKEIQRSYMQFYSSIFRHCAAVSSLISKHPILFVLFFVKPQSLADNAKEMWVLLISLYLKMDMNKQSTSEMLDWFRICVIFTWTSIPKVQEIWPPEAAIFSSIYKCQINIQLQGCGTVGALMGIYLEGIFTTKADIEDGTCHSNICHPEHVSSLHELSYPKCKKSSCQRQTYFQVLVFPNFKPAVNFRGLELWVP